MIEVKVAKVRDRLSHPVVKGRACLGTEELTSKAKPRQQKLDKLFNASVDDIFKNKYLSPRPQTTTLQIPVQGIGEWCHPELTADINDSV